MFWESFRDMPRWTGLFVVAVALLSAWSATAQAPEAPLAAWRVECAGDGKNLECRALQQVVNREDNKQPLAQLTVRTPADSKMPVMMIQLPLGVNLTEPIQLKVDNGPVDKQSIQTCTPSGCFVGMQLNDKFLASLRNGSLLKITLQDAAKRPTTVDVPLLGFGPALDKAK
jgi:invasion protein IalB